MEKQGVIAPEITPPVGADNSAAIKNAADDRLAAIKELDGDFRKAAAEATRKSLR